MNPFATTDVDRGAIWTMLVERDIEAFVNRDWTAVADDFFEAGFLGLDAGRKSNPDGWTIAFPTLGEYKAEWLKQAEIFAESHAEVDPKAAIHRLTTLRDIEIVGDVAVAHKKFDGSIALKEGGRDRLLWQTLYYCRKVDGHWKITGFTGYLPNPMGVAEVDERFDKHRKCLPAGATQHLTAGPYSPVLEIEPGRLVVISGQAALNDQGDVVGDSIEDQTRLTLENCFKQLATAGCSPADVFKVNIFMTDLDEWPRMNAVYREMMPEPQPVRTAVQAGLLFTLRVEIEMWAIKS